MWRVVGLTLFLQLGAAALCAASAQDDEEVVVRGETFGPRLINNIRVRYEGATTDDDPLRADALTIRYRGTFETHLSERLTFLTEVEAVGALLNNFDNGTGNEPERPVVLDPDGIELNRAQIIAAINDDTRVTVGRQRIILDDERFVGAFGFRQNDQTFDAVRVNSKLFDTVQLDASYVRRSNRALSNDNPNGVFRGDSYLLNANAPTPLGRVSVFHYALDLESGPTDDLSNDFSTRTTGVRLTGRRHWDDFGLVWEASYARQTDFAENPIDYAANYWLGSVAAIVGDATFTFRSEILSSDNDIRAFQTPLGTLHKFQGDADLFLVTPDHGVEDLSAALEWRFGSYGPIRDIKGSVRYHDFNGEFAGEQLGTEIDLAISAKYNRFGLSLAFADYDADVFATDTQRVFVTVTRAF